MCDARQVGALLAEWRGARWITTEFVKGLGDEGLTIALPRPGLDTFCKHFQEMVDVQEAYVGAIRTGVMSLANVSWHDGYLGDESAADLLRRMADVDSEMADAVRAAPGSLAVEWLAGGTKTLPALLVTLCAHEMLHVGQLIAFCYATDTPLPRSLVDSWALPRQMPARRS